MKKKQKDLSPLLLWFMVGLVWTIVVYHCAHVEGIDKGRKMEAQAITAVFLENIDSPKPFVVPQLGAKGMEFCLFDDGAVSDIAEREIRFAQIRGE